jgi:hypothetical protein
MQRDPRPPVIVYSDASFDPQRRKAILGFYVKNPLVEHGVWGSLELPDWFYEHLAPDKKTYIMQAEIIAAIAVYYSLPDMLRGRSVVHFIDNTGALSAMIHGYARQPDCARLVNVFHAQALGLGCECFFEWVPSKANIADVPTRLELLWMLPHGSKRVNLVLPPIDRFYGSLSDWVKTKV